MKNCSSYYFSGLFYFHSFFFIFFPFFFFLSRKLHSIITSSFAFLLQAVSKYVLLYLKNIVSKCDLHPQISNMGMEFMVTASPCSCSLTASTLMLKAGHEGGQQHEKCNFILQCNRQGWRAAQMIVSPTQNVPFEN